MDSARGYDFLAPYYDALTFLVFGDSLYRAQIHFLKEIQPNSKILVVGGGTGRWFREAWVREANPEITYIDISEKMLHKARVNGEGINIKFIQSTPALLKGGEDFDVIVAFCFFDLFDDLALQEVVSQLARSMKLDGRWLIVDFVDGKWWQGLVVSMMYFFFRIVTSLKIKRLPKWRHVMKAAGFREEKSKSFYGQLITSGLWIRS